MDQAGYHRGGNYPQQAPISQHGYPMGQMIQAPSHLYSPLYAPQQQQPIGFAPPFAQAPSDLMHRPQPSQAQDSQLPNLNNLYKTQLCKHFQQTKHCHVGNKCHFAHGENELRKKEDVLPVEVQMKMLNIPYNNFKTQKCKYFYESETPGQCKFGKNCSYAHGDVDIRNPYVNVDLETLVKEHYGVESYNPTKSETPSKLSPIAVAEKPIGQSMQVHCYQEFGHNPQMLAVPQLSRATSLPQQPNSMGQIYVAKVSQKTQAVSPQYNNHMKQQPQYVRKVSSSNSAQQQQTAPVSTFQQPSPQNSVYGPMAPQPLYSMPYPQQPQYHEQQRIPSVQPSNTQQFLPPQKSSMLWPEENSTSSSNAKGFNYLLYTPDHYETEDQNNFTSYSIFQ